MQYYHVVSGKFLSRPNRFVAEVEIAGKRETVHVKNTGRCRELLLPGTEVFLVSASGTARKTAYDLIAVKKKRSGKKDLLINIDSQIPNDAALEWLKNSGWFSPDAVFSREVVHGSSRFDIAVQDGERRTFIEVKGVTLENNGMVMFPDAPTRRGVKHLNELIQCVQDGFEAYLFLVIQMEEAEIFRPNDAMDPEFGKTLRNAARAGVKIIAMSCKVAPDTINVASPVKVSLDQ